MAKSAGEVYADYGAAIFQIRIMEEKSGSRAALGSGFLVADGQYLVTNYHVVSGKVMTPEKYRVEIDVNDTALVLNIHAVDAVNDLALLSVPNHKSLGQGFVLAEREPPKGAKVFSLGNPHDIGMTVVEGNYNGLVENSFLERIHFSGAINSGMSGGPAVNEQAQIVGVNVASAGNQIGFLVPVDKVRNLLSSANLPLPDGANLLSSMAGQLKVSSTEMVDQLLSAEWPKEPLGAVSIVGKTVPWVDCWGNSNENEDDGSLSISRGCNNGRQTFLEHRFTTGYIEYEFFYFEAKDWPSVSVYSAMAEDTAYARPANKVHEKRVGNFSCVNDLVSLDHGMTQRISYCTRPYRQFEGLYDAFFIAVSTDREKQVAMSHFTMAGVTKESSVRFLNRFIGEMAWR